MFREDKKIEDAVSLPDRMQVPISNLVLVQPSEIEIIRSEFTFERSKMEQKYLKLQEIADKAESMPEFMSIKPRKWKMSIPRQKARMRTCT